MMVTFISQCEKKALTKTRRILDSFATRIGDRTWQTVITNAGLEAVKKQLRKTASKNSAISCHWLRSNIRSDLVWIVGNRMKFNESGIVPISSTKTNIINIQWENDWHYMPLIKALTALAALLHDWGKASECFQNKLSKKNKSTEKNSPDPLRHEWISCCLLKALIGENSSDSDWLSSLASGNIDEEKMKEKMKNDLGQDNPLRRIPKIAGLLAWLIVSHHRLPMKKDDYKNSNSFSLEEIFTSIDEKWGYANNSLDVDKCFEFSNGLLRGSSEWLKQVKKWSTRLLDNLGLANESLENGAWRLVLHFSRLSLMLGDHNYSSQPANDKWESQSKLYANTYKEDGKKKLKQKLDEHLVGVKEKALFVTHLLPFIESKMEYAYDVDSLKMKSPTGFEWQDKARTKISEWKLENPNKGFFIINMASTGCGKTIANAKIMRSLSEDKEGLRYILALGLRTLTLQTGDEYREKIGLDETNLAVLIGSKAVKELHENSQKQSDESSHELDGSESVESLLGDEDLNYDNTELSDGPLSTILSKDKHKQFLYAPVLVCTIDHLMAATETIRGGRYILPSLRLMSSDLVIDEVDDFDGDDLIAIGRLIHLAGMLGRKVMISSATIPPDLAEGYFNAYREGFKLFSETRRNPNNISCTWVDEFSTNIETVVNSEGIDCYRSLHNKFVEKRVKSLQDVKLTPIRRKGEIVECGENKESFFKNVEREIIKKHNDHHTIDQLSKKRISFGLVRMANINPCVELAKALIQSKNWPDNFSVKIMAYHSQQILLLRHEQEKHLDEVLKRKEKEGENPEAFNNNIIRNHINQSPNENLIFILVSTPIEEVGRDHDFDWAIIEPSSFRSIVQLAGRVLRHRNKSPEVPNIALMNKNLKAIEGKEKKEEQKAYYCNPGYEGYQQKGEYTILLTTHNLTDLIEDYDINTTINAVPRISKDPNLKHTDNLAHLEHYVINDLLTNYSLGGPATLQGWLTESWFLTALPQFYVKFRNSTPSINLYRSELKWCEKDDEGKLIDVNYYGIENDNRSYPNDRLWLERDYEELVEKYAEEMGKSREWIESRYGELNLKNPKHDSKYSYSDQFGITKRK